jgi:hypothetical protein
VTTVVFLAGAPSTLTSRPTGHCTDWWRSSSSWFNHIALANLLWSHWDVPAFKVCNSRLGPARAWRGINAGLTKLRSPSLAVFDMSHCQWEVGSTKRIPGFKVSQGHDRRGARRRVLPSSWRSGFKLMDPDQMFIFNFYHLDCFPMAVFAMLKVLGGQSVVTQLSRVGGTRHDARCHVKV